MHRESRQSVSQLRTDPPLQCSGLDGLQTIAQRLCGNALSLASFTKVPPIYVDDGDIHMIWGALTLFLLVVVVVALSKRAGRNVRGARSAIDVSAYYAVKPLTKTEQAFFRLLESSLPGYVILAQVDIKRIVRTKRGKSHQHFNRVAQLSLDYVICRRDFSVVAAVELDDPSHDRQRQRIRDEKKEAVMKAVDIRLVRFDVRRYPTEFEVRKQLLGEKGCEESRSMAA